MCMGMYKIKNGPSRIRFTSITSDASSRRGESRGKQGWGGGGTGAQFLHKSSGSTVLSVCVMYTWRYAQFSARVYVYVIMYTRCECTRAYESEDRCIAQKWRMSDSRRLGRREYVLRQRMSEIFREGTSLANFPGKISSEIQLRTVRCEIRND